MSILDQLAQLKGQLQPINDEITDLQARLAAAKTRRQQLQADMTDLQAFVDWKKANP